VTDPLTLLANVTAELAELRSRVETLELELAAGATVKRWLTVRETADYLGTTERAVYARLDRGRIPRSATRKQGRALLVDRERLDRHLERSS
jgi:excisionase family DNA binding protein